MNCHDAEYLLICHRFVDSKYNIREEFLVFVKSDRIRAIDIVDAIMKSWLVYE